MREILELVDLAGREERQAASALGRPAAARRARARDRQQPARAPARRAARRARPQAAQADAARAEADPERDRDHVRPRHARPGGGDDDGGHDRRHERRPDRAARLARPSSTSGRGRRSSPASSASRTCSTAPSTGDGLVRLDDGSELRAPHERVARAPSPSASGRRRSASATDGANRLAGTVKESAYIGVATEVVVDTPVGELTVFHQNVEAGGVAPAPGSQVTLSLGARGDLRRRSRRGEARMTMRMTRRAARPARCGRRHDPVPARAPRRVRWGRRGRRRHRRGRRRAAVLELAALHRLRREDEEAPDARPVHRSRPGSRSTTSRTSTRTPSTSGRSRARSRRGAGSTATSSSSPTTSASSA